MAEFKKRVALKALRGGDMVEAIAARHEIQPSDCPTKQDYLTFANWSKPNKTLIKLCDIAALLRSLCIFVLLEPSSYFGCHAT